MKMKFGIISTLCLSLVMTSCGGGHQDETEEQNEEKCFYYVNQESFDLTWTAYKTTGKIPVGGTFDQVKITGDQAENKAEALEGVEFEITTSTVNSQNEERDVKISEHFFGTFETPAITGKVTAVDADNGKATVMITMHGISYDVEGDLAINEDAFTFDAAIDVYNWNGMAAINALNEVCYELHKGEDGESKLWSEVAVSFSGSFVEDCK